MPLLSYCKYGYRRGAGGLKESLATSVYISEEQFKKRLQDNFGFEYYGYDSRVHQALWLSKDTIWWLFIEFVS